jgi:antitoxin component of MazEF toxin-antitoxin module
VDASCRPGKKDSQRLPAASASAVILPSDFASQLLIIERVNDSELRIKKGRAVRKRMYTFKELVDAITPENRHSEIA